jgi:diadenosine tetraphosphate (Ap4A) HIT family hydrolase
MQKFTVGPALQAMGPLVGSLKLSDALLADDARFPWIVLVPRRTGARELDHLTAPDRARLMEEAVVAGAAVRAVGAARGRPVFKLNVGALGNITAQLHLHVVGRREDDPCWPGPVWGCGSAEALGSRPLREAVEIARHALGLG